ncbi:hypothetical protein P201_gp07 [Pelagibacter phage HTVC201P]|nr:hypothetical protein P201_gp07 [Pelagibacter phage HTVC201P]
MSKQIIKNQAPKNAYNQLMDYTVDNSFKLVKNILTNKLFNKSKTSSCIFLMQIMQVCINRLFYEGYCKQTVKDMLSHCLKSELEFIAYKAKEEVKDCKL